MKSEEIKAKIKDLEEQRRALDRQIVLAQSELNQALTEEGAFRPGQKVDVYRIGTLRGSGIYGEVYTEHGIQKHRVWKVKKDGTASKNQWGPWDFDRVEDAQ